MIDIAKLENVRERGGKTIARCPACAEDGGDKTGNHLVIFEEGRFGCAAFPGDPEHRKRIYALVGKREEPGPTQFLRGGRL